MILVGGRGWLFDQVFAQVEALGLGNRVRFVGYVPDEMLPSWYNAATALVYPSLYEGFGLPIIEAMACGTPVVAANSSSLPEAGGATRFTLTHMTPTNLARRIGQLLDDETLRGRAWRRRPHSGGASLPGIRPGTTCWPCISEH